MRGWEMLKDSVDALEHIAYNGWQIKGKEEKAKPPSHDPRAYGKLQAIDKRFENMAFEIDNFLNFREEHIKLGKCLLPLENCVNCERLEPKGRYDKYEGGSGCWAASAKLIAFKKRGDWEKILQNTEKSNTRKLGYTTREDIEKVMLEILEEL